MSDLTGKVALISGAARGQGAAEARLFVERGAKVVIADVLDEDAWKLAADLGADNATAVHLDVSDPEQWAAALDAGREAFGKVDVLVNNAGIYFQGAITETPVERYRKLIDVNQIGVFLGMRTLAPHMASLGGGSIVNIVSMSSFAPLDLTSAYASTKSALLGMSKAAVGELGPLGIRVNMIHPGGVATDMGAPAGVVPEAYKQAPLGRIGEPREIATVAAFLASDDSSYCSGAEILVDGGWTVGTRNPWATAQ
ncbi:SDR family NAD(P)-dependent oxidoreductase [Streptomyces lanatus]|uniref:Glucose 1-dehydrogenase n=1 Tax=Streptomyces lanatus TaxID=66900 RepID=A0ABV1XT58_9ACTN|nr:glucose 1-dehydrogenase [Streptomyces lanatus]GHH09874.1 3-alpha-hydroxysteroid dehydrogenase [Streptomyces lanatus]